MRAWTMCGLLAIGGCFSDLGGGSSNAMDTTSAGSTSVGETSLPTTGPQTGTGSTSEPGTSTSATSGEPSTGEPTTGSPEGQPCDPYSQDCPDGYKCAPYASDGGPAWDANKCVPETGNDTPGQGCTVEGSATSGYDSCVEGTVCTNVGDALTGICTSLCGGSEDNPTCDLGLGCLSTNDGALNLCVQRCDPLDDDPCELADQVCVDDEDAFLCVEGFGLPVGAVCEFLNDCGEGLFCGEAVASYCKASAPEGCCLRYCDDDLDCPDMGLCTVFDPPSSEYPLLGYCGDAP
jgi:hypothetical protein